MRRFVSWACARVDEMTFSWMRERAVKPSSEGYTEYKLSSGCFYTHSCAPRLEGRWPLRAPSRAATVDASSSRKQSCVWSQNTHTPLPGCGSVFKRVERSFSKTTKTKQFWFAKGPFLYSVENTGTLFSIFRQ